MTRTAFPPDPTIAAKGYAHPEVLVSTQWLADHLEHPQLRLLECDEDVLLFDIGHIPGAQKIDWHTDLNDPVMRDYVGREAFQALLRRMGIDDDTLVVFYGDKNNWWAAYAFWVFRLFGFTNARLLDGGRLKWELEERPFVTELATRAPSHYVARERDDARIRAFLPDVLAQSRTGGQLVDVRSPAEFTGEKLHMPEYPQEGAMRGGHVPGARSVPWARAANADGTFRSADELRAIYEHEQGLVTGRPTITYCRIGERSSHTWFALTFLLGHIDVRNYDGSWTEYGNAVRTPIETGPAAAVRA
ncbi:MAG: sulfurtransferase [Gemmatimonadaceae bacterium]|jgi:thiosulfate/3-mercaptopyruvate sulfurtransferase|nr:sulfurtransferase [Gemmatimonadaceae bacterium]